VIDLVLEEVIGWDVEKDEPRENFEGMLGPVEAFIISVEEQGRKTLHAHIQVWVKKMTELRDKLHSTNKPEAQDATRKIVRAVDKVSSTSFMFAETAAKHLSQECAKAFPHACTASNPRKRRAPEVVDDQKLRNLRHRVGQHGHGGHFAKCPHCTMTWTNTEFVESYLKHYIKVPRLSSFPDVHVNRLKAMAVEHQRSTAEGEHAKTVIEAAYNLHMHNKNSCFSNVATGKGETGSTTGKRKRESHGDECRYRYPKRKKRRTCVIDASTEKIKWHKFDGSFNERRIKEVVLARHKYDLFQNTSCRAISHSKLACNTNLQFVVPGPIAQYQFKYTMKETQEQDAHEFRESEEAIKKCLASERKHESNRSEAVRRLLIGSFAHHKSNIVGAPMASYLTRNKSRFRFSHKFVWVPLRDLSNIIHGRNVNAMVKCHKDNTRHYHCVAMHYLCRPVQLQDMCPHDFFSKFEVVKVTSKNRDTLLKFQNSHWQHPSYKNGRFLEGVRLRKTPLLTKVFQYDFPDSASFGGHLLNNEYQENSEAERYCELALLLFSSYRDLSDFQHGGTTHTHKFRNLVNGNVITDVHTNILQNIQNASYNCHRHNSTEDDLARNTNCFEPDNLSMNANKEDDEFEDDCKEINGQALDVILEMLNSETQTRNGTSGQNIPNAMNFSTIKNKGTHKCGYEHLAEMTLQRGTEIFVENAPHARETNQQTEDATEDNSGSDRNVQTCDIVKVLLEKTSRRQTDFFETTGVEEPVDLLEANGSVTSILDWAEKAKLDIRQRRAFEIITASFVMSFYNDAPSATGEERNTRSVFSREKRKLQKLLEVRARNNTQMICFLHGPAGSGKTSVIDLVIMYAKQYCEHLGHRFTSRTIVVTAMSGVAATILRGETTHSAVHLLQKKPLSMEQIENWIDTRLVIIDEVSFASKSDFEKLHQKLSQLKQCLQKPYGGLNVVFAGDFRQLEPVSTEKNVKRPVYDENCHEFRGWVNYYVELEGRHRFKNDPEWGNLLYRFRDGDATLEDIDSINACVVHNKTELPKNIRYATYFNRDRDAINTAIYESTCRTALQEFRSLDDSIMVFCDNIKVKNGTKVYEVFRNWPALWNTCGEDDVKLKKGRMDPVLRLYVGCLVMLTENTKVTEGLANGTQATIQKITLKHGVTPKSVSVHGVGRVKAVLASEVESVTLRHCNDRITPATFKLKPTKYTFRARVLKPQSLREKDDDREIISMKAVQLPFVINNATTGHKLQGSGVDTLFVHSWSYVTNWVYVMLSRVKTKKGLYMRQKLKRDLSKYKMPDNLKRMINSFKTKAPHYWTDEEYDTMFK
jgi:ATP-dependent DNA helicase PIF1